MLNRISDYRNAPATMDEAKSLFDALAQSCIALSVRDAQLEKCVAKLKAEYAAETDEFRKDIEDMERVLSEFILGNRDWFQDPRKVKTDFGSFGLQAVNEIDVKDEAKAIEAVIERKFKDCFETVTKLVKAGIKARLEAGEKIPGVSKRSGDTAVYGVKKALIDRAKNEGGTE